jgi:hypothetical protein
MIYNKELGYVFVAIPKTGTRSMYKILMEKYGAIEYADHWHIIPEEMKDFYKFTIVRNPYDRFVSLWWSTSQRPLYEGAGGNFRKMAGGNDMKSILSWMIKSKKDNKINKESIFGHQLLLTQSTYLNETNFDVILETETLNEDFSTRVKLFDFYDCLDDINSTKITNKVNGPARVKNPFYYIRDKEALDMINYYYAEDFNSLPQYDKVEVIP